MEQLQETINAALREWPVGVTLVLVQVFKGYDKKANNHAHKKLYPLVAILVGLVAGYISIGNPADWWLGIQTGFKTCAYAACAWMFKEASGLQLPGDRSQKGK